MVAGDVPLVRLPCRRGGFWFGLVHLFLVTAIGIGGVMPHSRAAYKFLGRRPPLHDSSDNAGTGGIARRTRLLA